MSITLPLQLSRTCNLADFPNCLTVAGWQQLLALTAWQQWTEAEHLRTRDPAVCVNALGLPFVAPGPTPIYTNGIEMAMTPETIDTPISAVFGLSVLDHIGDPVRFLKRAAKILQPPGLLFLTFAFWDAEGPDCAAGHQGRTRIYDVHSWKKLVTEAKKIGFRSFGGTDWVYHGDKLEDHTLASLVLTRRAEETYATAGDR